jgi:phosphoribosylglycinamide formyltransferase-1
MTPRLAILISGRGSNLQAIIDAVREGRLRAEIAIVVSNVADAPGLARATAAGIATRVLPHREYDSRARYDQAVVDVLREHGVTLVCLAGFMRLLSPTFLDAFPNRVVNIHPSLLPAFPGVDAPRQAWTHGVKITGVTVHLVDAALDAGPIVMQRAVAVHDDDTAETLADRILEEEHRMYPAAIQQVLDGRWRVEGRRFVSSPVSASGESAPTHPEGS